MDEYLSRLVLADNPWISGFNLSEWTAGKLPANYLERTIRLATDQRVCLVVGPRQAGKSSLIWKQLSDSKQPCLYVNCEEPLMQQWLGSPGLFLDDLAGLWDRPVALFFEEIQHLDNAGLFLKGIADRKHPAPVYATGSSAFDLGARVRESLAGRALRHLLLPFSLAETTSAIKGARLVRKKRVQEALGRMLVYGGYPVVCLSDQPERELSVLVESFVVRDASDRLRIRFPAAYRKVLELAASQVGSLCNFSAWAAPAGISNDTVAEYLGLMEETHVVRLVRPFAGGKRAEITSAPKVYFVDNGIRNLLFGGFADPAGRPDRGALFENFAFSEILKYTNPLLDSVRFWRSKAGAEVDFVVEHQGKLLACEVKAGDPGDRLTRSAQSFIAAYQPALFLVAGSTEHAARQVDRTEVRFIRLDQLGEAVRSFVSD